MAIIKVGDAATTPTTKPVLNFDFANSKTVDPRLNFGRSSTATYFSDSETYICDENRFPNSSNLTTFDYSRHSISDGIATPYGESTGAYQFTQDGTTNAGYIGYLSWPFNVGYFTYSIWAKAGPGGGYIRFDERQNYTKITWFNLNNGTVGTKNVNHTAHIEDAGNGWYRCSITTNSVGGTTQLLWYFADGDGSTSVTANAVSGYLWGPQYTRTDHLTHYVPTTGVARVDRRPKMVEAPVDRPRIDHDPYTGKSLGVLIEGARTNLIGNSKFSPTGASYQGFIGNNGATYEVEYGPGLDGTNSAVLLRYGGANHNSSASYWYYTSAPLTNGTKYTFSVYVKMLEYSKANGLRINLHSNSFTDNGDAYFNLSEEPGASLGPGGMERATIEPVGDNWYRLSVTATSKGSGYFDIGLYAKYFDGGIEDTSHESVADLQFAHSFMIWGTQLEAAAFPSSYIPTTTGAVTRSNESLTLNNAHLYITPSSGMTVAYKRIVKNEVYANSYTAQLAGGGGFILFRSAGVSGGSVGANIRDSAGYNGSATASTSEKEVMTAISFSKDKMQAAYNGTYIGEDTTVYYEGEWNILYFGGTGTSNERLFGYISNFTIYPEDLTQAQLVELSEE